jgi:hypothetical protein
MKRIFAVSVLLSVGFCVCAAGAFAETGNSCWVKIPFAFYAGDKLMPAGKYLFDMPRMSGFASGTMLQVSSPDGVLSQYLFSMRVDGITWSNDYHIAFSRYGDAYFLSKVRNGELGAQIFRSRTEKKLSSEYAKGSPSVSTYEMVLTPSRTR